MKWNFRYSIATALTVLILFSTIGFNIIVSFCGGCDSEHINISLTADTTENCSCCANDENATHCCAKQAEENKQNNQKKNILAQLKFDSTEAKAKVVKIILPVINFFFSIIGITNDQQPVFTTPTGTTQQLGPPLSGKSILLMNCILRN